MVIHESNEMYAWHEKVIEPYSILWGVIIYPTFDQVGTAHLTFCHFIHEIVSQMQCICMDK